MSDFVGLNNQEAHHLAQHLKTKSILAKNVRKGDIVIEDDFVTYVTKVSRDKDENVVLGEVDENDATMPPDMRVTILDRKITKKVR